MHAKERVTSVGVGVGYECERGVLRGGERENCGNGAARGAVIFKIRIVQRESAKQVSAQKQTQEHVR